MLQVWITDSRSACPDLSRCDAAISAWTLIGKLAGTGRAWNQQTLASRYVLAQSLPFLKSVTLQGVEALDARLRHSATLGLVDGLAYPRIPFGQGGRLDKAEAKAAIRRSFRLSMQGGCFQSRRLGQKETAAAPPVVITCS